MVLGGTFVLLCDGRNPTFRCDGALGERGLMPFLRSLVPPPLHDRVAMVTIQQVVAAVAASGRHKWVGEFTRKYGL